MIIIRVSLNVVELQRQSLCKLLSTTNSNSLLDTILRFSSRFRSFLLVILQHKCFSEMLIFTICLTAEFGQIGAWFIPTFILLTQVFIRTLQAHNCVIMAEYIIHFIRPNFMIWKKWRVFKATIVHCKAILGRGQHFRTLM